VSKISRGFSQRLNFLTYKEDQWETLVDLIYEILKKDRVSPISKEEIPDVIAEFSVELINKHKDKKTEAANHVDIS
jgi:hypothetical protein